jgi:threonine dehydratase
VTLPPHRPTRQDIDAAARRIRPFAWHTPCVPSAWLSDVARADVWLKLEVVQATGSFKIRGAANALLCLKAARPDVTGVVTASAGNHGQAIALAARRIGLRACVYVPAAAPTAKLDAIRRLGAEVVLAPTYDDAERRAREASRGAGAVYVSPYNDADVIAGAGTVALEILEDVPALDAVVIPLGGGGLLSGAAIVAKSSDRQVRVIGAEAQASPVFTAALAARRIVAVEVGPTLADGLAGNLEPGSQTFDLVRDLADRVALVSESSIELAMRELIRHERLIVEGAGATAVGALLDGNLDLAGKTVGVVLSGRNVDVDVVRRVLGPPASRV